jgi:predicted ATPase
VPDFRNGVFWVALAAIRDAAVVSEEVGHTLGARDDVADHVGDREMLLVLDNLEQVVEVGPELADILERCPNLRMLVTSRELLRVRGEVEYSVEPLPLSEAVDLFVTRAQLQPDAAITQLCQRLEGLPLAVELAAARARLLSPAQLLERLGHRLDLLKGGRDADARQQTLRATIAWSHDLLATSERQLFARLAVFRGGFSLESAEVVADADIDTLQSLIDKSLVRLRDGRFSMLETVREFAAEQLAAQPHAGALARRHADYFLELAIQAEPHLPAYDRAWIDRLEEEHDNLRAAFDLYAETGDGQSMQRLAGALARFWFMRGYSVEGTRRLEAALAADDAPTSARAEALLGASLSGSKQVDEALARQAGEIFRSRGDRRGEALADLSLGNIRAAAGDWQAGRELLERSLATMVDLGEDHHALIVRRGLGWIYVELGLRSEGVAIHRDNLERARDLGNQRIVAITLGALAMERLAQGERDEATALLEESHRLHTAMGDPFQSALDVFRFASLMLAYEKVETAAKLAACSDALIDEMGLSLRGWDPNFVDDVNRQLRDGLDPATLGGATAEGRRLSADAAVELALAELAALQQPRSASTT